MKRLLDNHRPLQSVFGYSEDKAYCITTGHNYQWKIVDGIMYKTCAQCGSIIKVDHAPEPKEEDAT